MTDVTSEEARATIMQLVRLGISSIGRVSDRGAYLSTLESLMAIILWERLSLPDTLVTA